MAKIWVVEYEVIGHGHFPIDMLRYDCSYPVRGEITIPEGLFSDVGLEQRRVRLHHREGVKGWKPTKDRWNSLGWVVDEYSVREWSA